MYVMSGMNRTLRQGLSSAKWSGISEEGIMVDMNGKYFGIAAVVMLCGVCIYFFMTEADISPPVGTPLQESPILEKQSEVAVSRPPEAQTTPPEQLPDNRVPAMITNTNIASMDKTADKVSMSIGTQTFSVTIEATEAGAAFKKQLPATITMADLNSNEKYFDFSENLPARPVNPGMVQRGDLMLYGARTLVLFYETFPTSYEYTKLGHVDTIDGLKNVLGPNEVTVVFSVE